MFKITFLRVQLREIPQYPPNALSPLK